MGAAGDQGGRTRGTGRGAAPGLPRGHRDRLRRGQLDRPDRAHRQGAASWLLPVPGRQAEAGAAGCSTTASPGRTAAARRACGAGSSSGTCSPTVSWKAPATCWGHAGQRVRGQARGEPARALREDADRLVREPGGRTGTRRSPRSASRSRGCGGCIWPARGWASSAMTFSCTRCWASSCTQTAVPICRCVPTGNRPPISGFLDRIYLPDRHTASFSERAFRRGLGSERG